MKKIILCLISLLLLTGCSIDVNLVINSKKELDENITISNNSDVFDEEPDIVTDNYKKSYLSLLRQEKYMASFTSNKNEIKAKITNKNNKLIDFSNSVSFKQIFSDLKVEDNKYSFIISSDAISLLEDTYGIGSIPEMFFEEIPINIQFHNVIENANADKYNAKTNTYTWIINKDNLNRNIEFSITNEKRYDIIIPYLFKKYLGVIIFGLMLLTLIVLSVIVTIKSKRANQI